MFFDPSDFSKYVTDSQARLICAVIHELINENSTVVYGSVLKDGTASQFSSDKKAQDTHVALLIEPRTMGTFKPRSTGVKLDKPTDKDEIRALQDKIKVLEQERTR